MPRPLTRLAAAFAFAAAAAVAATLPALAQPAPRPLPEDATLLTLAESAEREVRPDTIRARLVAQATAETAAPAQSGVNAAMAKALERVRALGLEAETGGYRTWQETPPRPQTLPAGTRPPAPVWRAQQHLIITAKDDARVLEAVGSLQAEGMLLQELAYAMSPAQQRGLQDDLSAEALQRLAVRAEKAAAALGLRFEGWARIGLQAGQVQRPPMAVAARMDAMAAAAPPVAAPGDQTLSVSVEGEAILRRR